MSGITSLLGNTESSDYNLIPDTNAQHKSYFNLAPPQAQVETPRQPEAVIPIQPQIQSQPEVSSIQETHKEEELLDLTPPWSITEEEMAERKEWYHAPMEEKRKIIASLLMNKIYDAVEDPKVQTQLEYLRDHAEGRGLIVHQKEGSQGWSGGWTTTAILYPGEKIVVGSFLSSRGYVNERPKFKLMTPEPGEVPADVPLTKDGRTFIEVSEKPAGRATLTDAINYMLSEESGKWGQLLHDYPKYKDKLEELQSLSVEEIEADINNSEQKNDHLSYMKRYIKDAESEVQDQKYRRILSDAFTRRDGCFEDTDFPKDAKEYFDKHLSDALESRYRIP